MSLVLFFFNLSSWKLRDGSFIAMKREQEGHSRWTSLCKLRHVAAHKSTLSFSLNATSIDFFFSLLFQSVSIYLVQFLLSWSCDIHDTYFKTHDYFPTSIIVNDRGHEQNLENSELLQTILKRMNRFLIFKSDIFLILNVTYMQKRKSNNWRLIFDSYLKYIECQGTRRIEI